MDRRLLYCALALITIGMVMVYSSSSVLADSRFGSHSYFLKRQFIWLLLAGIAALAVLKIDLKKYAVYSVPLLLAALVMLAFVFFMPARNGSHRWLILGPLTIQPSEIFKLVAIVYLAFLLSRSKKDLITLKSILFPGGLIIGTGLVLIILEPSLGSALTITLTVLTILFLGGLRLFNLAALLLPLAAIGSFMIFVLGYKKARLLDYLAAIKDPLSGSYQIRQAVLAMGAGGILGSGLGNGKQKLFFLPYPHTDFIFASIGEELGLVGLFVVLTLYYLLIWRAVKIAWYQPDRFGYLLAMGIAISIAVSVLINVGMVTGLLPTIGIPLPLVSYGGSSLVVSVISIALLLNLSQRRGVIVR